MCDILLSKSLIDPTMTMNDCKTSVYVKIINDVEVNTKRTPFKNKALSRCLQHTKMYITCMHSGTVVQVSV